MRQTRATKTDFLTREENDELIIEGYFAVFGDIYNIDMGLSEEIAKGAFEGQTSGDVRALADHLTHLVLGRTTAGTLQLHEDDKGLYGKIKINPADSDAMNLYARVKRGDVTQCSFGFDIIDEEVQNKPDGSTHWIVKKVKLYEVSVCTFPAYEATQVEARKQEAQNIKKRELEAWKSNMKNKLRKED